MHSFSYTNDQVLFCDLLRTQTSTGDDDPAALGSGSSGHGEPVLLSPVEG